MHCRGLITTLVCAIWCTLAVGQAQTNDTFTAIPPSEAARYHIDFTRFFASPEAERAQRAKLDSILKELESLKGGSQKILLVWSTLCPTARGHGRRPNQH